MLEATFIRIAMDNQTNQFDRGPLAKRKELVQPKFEAKLQAARA
jgi:hypothetical protein